MRDHRGNGSSNATQAPPVLWPAEALNEFWAGHAALTTTLSALLLVGAGYLAFEVRENLQQQAQTESLATAAFGGLVDHLIDVDLALACLCRRGAPNGYTSEGKPLRWLRDQRDWLVSTRDSDPRWHGNGKVVAVDDWARDVVDQAVRRVMAAMRDWAPLLVHTRDGMALLIRVGRLRNRLLDLGRHLDPASWDAREAQTAACAIRAECTTLALGLELGSGVPAHRARPGVLVQAPPAVAAIAAELAHLQALARQGHLRQLRAHLANASAPDRPPDLHKPAGASGRWN